jgi:ribosomal protein S18 acetylase RimI-like enzyme
MEPDPLTHEKQAFLLDIELREDLRGMGIGKQLIHEVEDIARKHDVRKLSLRVEIYNRRALRFYLSSGFRPVALILSKEVLRSS